MQKWESVVAMVFECYLTYVGMACIKMYSFQETKGLTKELYFPGGRPVSMQNFRFTVDAVYLFTYGQD